ncbi:McrB family protein [Pontibacter ramchanderi]|uniref:5-methylcytosine-specific restriction protein B n=1 Tax=Pontibacter ramchanderi TaxID=1179743 RepID=A0A2N3V0X8_9BACT|nr:AAA family ATPase [Pontibacter ramchanderi]PKV75289.1 5-methylcytosine-specific restriction protein B [Pontibacter ramchanderi]
MLNSEALAQIRKGIQKVIDKNDWAFKLRPETSSIECTIWIQAADVTDKIVQPASRELVKNGRNFKPEAEGDLDNISSLIDYATNELTKYATLCGINGNSSVSAKTSDPINDLIRKYKEDLRLNGLQDELYKWRLLQTYRSRPNLDAADFTAEIKSIDFANLIYGVGIGVVHHLAKDRPEEYRACFKLLFNEELPLAERLNSFNSETLKLFRELQPNPKHSHHHDERTMATLLTYYNPDKYAFYKDSFYQKYCKLLGIKPKKVGEKYLHYLELLDSFISEYVVTDSDLLSLVDTLLPTDAFKDTNRKVLAQDILYRMLDKGLEEIEIGDASVYKISMGDFNDQEIADCIDQKKIIVHQNTKPLGQTRESQGFVYSSKIRIGDYFYLTPGNRNQAVSLLGKITGPATSATYNSYGDEGWLERPFDIIAIPKNKTKYTGKQKWWTPNSRTTCVAIDLEELEEANKLLIEPYFMAKLVHDSNSNVDSTDTKDDPIKTNAKEFKMPLNQILFGPPGTGKTYNTINKALEILGEQTEGIDRFTLKKVFENKVAEGQIMFTTFHQSMSYEDFIEGIKPQEAFDKDGNTIISYKVEPGIFKKICDKATTKEGSDNFDEVYEQFTEDIQAEDFLLLHTPRHNKPYKITVNSNKNFIARPETVTATPMVITKDMVRDYLFYGKIRDWKPYTVSISEHLKLRYKLSIQTETAQNKDYILIIDEINRGNVSQIFGELITLIEEDKRLGKDEQLEVTLPYSKEKFGVPANLYIIGTMNTADRSVEALDTALRRRFSFVEMPPRYDLEGLQQEVEGYKLADILQKINRRIEKLLGKDNLIGHSYFLCVKNTDNLRAAFQNKIIPLLQEYFYGDYGKIGLVLGEGFFKELDKVEEADIFASFGNYDPAGLSEKQVYHLAELIGKDRLSDDDFKSALEKLMK